VTGFVSGGPSRDEFPGGVSLTEVRYAKRLAAS
jgi:hypothetical protein